MALKKALPEENLALKKALPEENLALKITYRKGMVLKYNYRKRIGLSNIIAGKHSGSNTIILTDFLFWVVSFRKLPFFYTFPFNCP